MTTASRTEDRSLESWNSMFSIVSDMMVREVISDTPTYFKIIVSYKGTKFTVQLNYQPEMLDVLDLASEYAMKFIK